jgi:hypothetical protein
VHDKKIFSLEIPEDVEAAVSFGMLNASKARAHTKQEFSAYSEVRSSILAGQAR